MRGRSCWGTTTRWTGSKDLPVSQFKFLTNDTVGMGTGLLPPGMELLRQPVDTVLVDAKGSIQFNESRAILIRKAGQPRIKQIASRLPCFRRVLSCKSGIGV